MDKFLLEKVEVLEKKVHNGLVKTTNDTDHFLLYDVHSIKLAVIEGIESLKRLKQLIEFQTEK